MSSGCYLTCNPMSKMVYDHLIANGPMTSAQIARAFPEMDMATRKSITNGLRQHGLIVRVYPEKTCRYLWRAV